MCITPGNQHTAESNLDSYEPQIGGNGIGMCLDMELVSKTESRKNKRKGNQKERVMVVRGDRSFGGYRETSLTIEQHSTSKIPRFTDDQIVNLSAERMHDK